MSEKLATFVVYVTGYDTGPGPSAGAQWTRKTVVQAANRKDALRKIVPSWYEGLVEADVVLRQEVSTFKLRAPAPRAELEIDHDG